MKKKIFVVAVLLICLSLIGYSSLAYFTTEDTARNVITAGAVEVKVVEMQQLVDGTLQPYPAQPISVMPGTTVSKIVTLRSEDAAVFARAKLELTVLDGQGEKMALTQQELAKVIQLSAPGEGWTQKDGWWYYTDMLAGGASTTAFLESVSFSAENMTNEYQNCKVLIDITAQAVQAANNGTNAMEAMGWPET